MVRVEAAQEMHAAVLKEISSATVFIAAAGSQTIGQCPGQLIR